MGLVHIGCQVSRKTLEEALVKAARDIGLKARVEEVHRTDYRLGSVEEIDNLREVNVHLRKGPFPMMTATIPLPQVKGPGWIDYFILHSGPFGLASQNRYREYLEAVSKYVKQEHF